VSYCIFIYLLIFTYVHIYYDSSLGTYCNVNAWFTHIARGACFHKRGSRTFVVLANQSKVRIHIYMYICMYVSKPEASRSDINFTYNWMCFKNHNISVWENGIFSPKIVKKSPKIVIITSAPDWLDSPPMLSLDEIWRILHFLLCRWILINCPPRWRGLAN
jgi:hypothetical protein